MKPRHSNQQNIIKYYTLIEFYNYVNDSKNKDRVYYAENDKFTFYYHTVTKEFILYKNYFIHNNSFEIGLIRRPILLDYLRQLIRREKINNILKR